MAAMSYHINFKLQPIRWTGPYRVLEKVLPELYILDFHNTRRKYISSTSNWPAIHRSVEDDLELIRLKQKGERKDSFQDNNIEDDDFQ